MKNLDNDEVFFSLGAALQQEHSYFEGEVLEGSSWSGERRTRVSIFAQVTSLSEESSQQQGVHVLGAAL